MSTSADGPPERRPMRSLSERPVSSVIIVGMAASQPVHLVLLDYDWMLIARDCVVAAGDLSPSRVSRWT
jgi:hypothetical protein